MRKAARLIGIGVIAASVAACSTTGQTGGELGQSASDAIRQHPETAVGAGVGAAGGAVVGGLAGGTKGAVIGGLLGALTGGVIGNYVERRESSTPQSVGIPPGSQTAPQGSQAGGRSPAPPAPAPAGSGTPAPPASGALIRIDEVRAQPTDLRSGGTVNLGATYTVQTPADQSLIVRETREVRLNGELVANPAVDISRQTGTFSSSLPITLPANARPGRYDVTMSVATGDRQSTSTTSFYVQ